MAKHNYIPDTDDNRRTSGDTFGRSITSGVSIILVTGMLMLAGCGQIVPTDNTPTRTVSPAPVPSPSSASRPTPEPSYPAGIGAGQIRDPAALERAHRSVLANASYTVRFNETTRYANGSLQSQVISTARVGADGIRERRSIHVAGPGGHPPVFSNATQVSIYAEEADAFIRGAHDTDTPHTDNRTSVQYAHYSRRSIEPLLPRTWPGLMLSSLSAGMELRVTNVQRGNETLSRVESVELKESMLLAGALSPAEQARVENASLRGLVDPGGLVREYRLTYTLVHNGTVIHGVRSIRYQQFGTTEVRRPPWYDEAENATRNDSQDTLIASPDADEKPTGR